MTTIHLYGFSPRDRQCLAAAARCITSFDRDYKLLGWCNGTDYQINGRYSISCWRTQTGNISVRLMK